MAGVVDAHTRQLKARSRGNTGPLRTGSGGFRGLGLRGFGLWALGLGMKACFRFGVSGFRGSRFMA